MVNFNRVGLTFLLSELFSSPVTRETPTETESTTKIKIHSRLIDEKTCREFVIIGCECQKKDKSSKNQLDFYERCLFDGFTQYCDQTTDNEKKSPTNKIILPSLS